MCVCEEVGGERKESQREERERESERERERERLGVHGEEEECVVGRGKRRGKE